MQISRPRCIYNEYVNFCVMILSVECLALSYKENGKTVYGHILIRN